MLQPQERREAEDRVEGLPGFCDFALRIAGPADGQLEVSIDGAAYRPCRYADGYWWHYWSGALDGRHHMAVVLRLAAEEPSPRA